MLPPDADWNSRRGASGSEPGDVLPLDLSVQPDHHRRVGAFEMSMTTEEILDVTSSPAIIRVFERRDAPLDRLRVKTS
jgi:hypothetical protein